LWGCGGERGSNASLPMSNVERQADWDWSGPAGIKRAESEDKEKIIKGEKIL
jgi:hypothetical protein